MEQPAIPEFSRLSASIAINAISTPGLTCSVTLQWELGVNLRDAGRSPKFVLPICFQKSLIQDSELHRHHCRDARQAGNFLECCSADCRQSGQYPCDSAFAKLLMRQRFGPESHPPTKQFKQRPELSSCLRRFRFAPRSQSCFCAVLATTHLGFRRLLAGCCRSQPTR